MKRMRLSLKEVLNASIHPNPGFRRWDLSDDVSLYCSAKEEYYDGPLCYKGWSVDVHISSAAHPRLEWVLTKLTTDQARNFLWSKYARWVEE